MKTSPHRVLTAGILLGAIIAATIALTASADTTNCTPPPSGLVSWWRAEGNALDQAGTNNGTLVGSTTYGQGRVGQAFVFDGSGDAVSLGNPTNLQLQNFTIEAWVKRSSATRGSQDPVGSGSIFYGSYGGYGFGVWDDGQLVLTQIGVGGVESTRTITDTNNFHHVVVTKNGSAVVFYVDGNGETAAAYNPGFVFNGPFAIGARGTDYVGSFLGSIDEVSVYSRALSAAEIQSIYNADGAGKCTGPTAPSILVQPANQTVTVGVNVTFSVTASGTAPLSYQWRKDGNNLVSSTSATLFLASPAAGAAGGYDVVVTNVVGSVTSSVAVLTLLPVPTNCVPPPSGLVGWWLAEGNALDQAGTNNGTLVGNTTYGVGRVGQAFMFDGNGDGMAVGNASNLRLQDFTVEAWVKRASTSIVSYGAAGAAVIFGYGSGGYALMLDSSGHPDFGQLDVGGIIVSAIAITDTNFHHFAVTKSGSAVVFYVDGVAYPAAAYNATFASASGAAIGARGDTLGNSFLGSIDEVSVYNRALAVTEIQSIYIAGSAGKCAEPYIIVQPRSQVGYWGKSVMFTVTAGGSAPLSYQWRKTSVPIGGATGSSLVLTNLQLADTGNYSVVISNSVSSVTSSNAYLTMNPAGVSLALYSGITIDGVVGLTYGIQYSTDLTSTNGWRGMANVTLGAPTELWFDVYPASKPQRYYRIVSGPISVP